MRLGQLKVVLSTFLCFLVFASGSCAQQSQEERHIEVSLRMIGHQLLLTSGDSTSRVLPIQKVDDRYKVEFASDFALNPDDLVNTVNKVIDYTEIADNYIVQVEECSTDKVVYSYEMGFSENTDIITCRARSLPKSCYSLLFTLMNNDEQAALSASDASGLKRSNLSYFFISILVLLGTGTFLFLWRRRRKSLSDPNLIPLGEYQFDLKNTELLFEQRRIELTNKEADLLTLLYEAVNTTIEREVILKRVWGDEGDYVGRTLDVFISKLRKKLEADPKVKIVNIRGVGYKLVTNV